MTPRALLSGLMACVTLSACASTAVDPDTGLYVTPIGGAPATGNVTPLSPALTCLAEAGRARGLAAPRLAIGNIDDLTGKLDLETGRRVTQGAALFAVTAFGRAGVPMVERADQTVAEVERTYAAAQVLSDSPTGPGLEPGPVRVVNPGQIAGSRYYLVGGVTELNYNIESSGGELGVGALNPEDAKTGIGGSRFVMNVAIDLRLIDSISQEVVAVAAYQKQIVGREIRAGVFDIMGGVAFDLSGGVSALEPLQLGVRSLIERAAYDVAADLYALPATECLPREQISEVAGGYSRLRDLPPPSALARPVRIAAETNPSAAPTLADQTGFATPAPIRSGTVLTAPALPERVGPPPSEPPAGAPARPRIDPRTWRLQRAPGP